METEQFSRDINNFPNKSLTKLKTESLKKKEVESIIFIGKQEVWKWEHKTGEDPQDQPKTKTFLILKMWSCKYKK